MTTNTQNANANQVRSLRDMLVPALLFYVVMTAMFVGLDAFMDKPTSMNLPFMPFLVSMVSFTSDARRAWDWRNGTKVVAVLTAVAMLLAFIYQLAVGEMNLLGVGIYPATAILLLAISWVIRAIGKTAPFQSRETPGAVWCIEVGPAYRRSHCARGRPCHHYLCLLA